MEGRRMDLSATQVIASMLAAVTGAVAASYLGVAGTVIGAAVMSVASTAVAAVYKHYIGRSHQRLRAAAEAARHAPRVGGEVSSGVSGRAAIGARPRATEPGTALPRPAALPWSARGPDAERTEMLPVGALWPPGPGHGTTQITRAPDESRTRPVAGAGASPAGAADRSGDAGGSGDAGASRGTVSRRRRPLALAGVAAVVFLAAMAGITAFEAAAGKPLDAVVGGHHGSGTTIGSLVGGTARPAGSRPTSPARPSVAPTPRASTSSAPSPTPTPTPSPAPSGSPTSSPSPSAAAPGSAASGSP